MQSTDPLQNIPDPQSLRDRLAAKLDEVRILRRLLKVAEAESKRRAPESEARR